MKNILILLTVLLLPLTAAGQDKSSFSAREMADVRVATPGLFAKSNHIYLHLDSLKDHEYAFPLPGGKVISAYGTRGGHSGTDIKTCAKDTIRAAFDGVVRMSKPYYAYGNIVVIRHANGLETLYSHNFKNLVKTGDVVKAGQPIGLTGIHPRNFIITPNGKYLLVACRDSNVIQVYERDADTGLLTDVQQDIKVDKPVCIKFVP